MVKSMKSGKSIITANLGKMQKSLKNGGGLRLFVKWLYQMSYKDKKMEKQKKIFFFKKNLQVCETRVITRVVMQS